MGETLYPSIVARLCLDMAIGRLCLHELGLEAEPPMKHPQRDSGNEVSSAIQMSVFCVSKLL